MMQNDKMANVDSLKEYGRCTHDCAPENTNNGVGPCAQGTGLSSVKKGPSSTEKGPSSMVEGPSSTAYSVVKVCL